MPSENSLIRSAWASKRGKVSGGGLAFPTTNKTSHTTVGDTAFVVPTGVTVLGVKAWGAGGGAAATGLNGGAGSFIQTTITVTPGETITIRVGGSSSTFTASAHGGGGNGGDATADGGAGGGYSGVLRSGTILACAAGGGGASPNVDGGGGDRNGAETGSPPRVAYAGTIDMGGSASGGTYTGSDGTAGQGGAAGNGVSRGGGGGGGGYYGGAGGNGGDNSAITGSGSGAGGSSFLPTTPASGFVNTLMRPNGISATAPNTSDADYVSGKCAGAVGSGAGGDGLVVITY